jgi:two-component system response regulator YesN
MNSNVLIVDDEKLIRKTLMKMIQDSNIGWSIVAEAGNGEEAIKKVREHSPDLVITDIRMPRVNGIELAKYIYEYFTDTRVVILTAYKDFEYAQAALKYKVLDFLLKPCPQDDVVNLLTGIREEIMQKKSEEIKEKKLNERMLIRSLCLRLPYDPQIADALEEKYIQSDFMLLKVNHYSLQKEPSKSTDLQLLQYSLINIVEELLNMGQSNDQLIPVEYDTYVFILTNEKSKNDFSENVVMKVESLLDISLSSHHLGRLTRLEDVTTLYSRYYEGSFLSIESNSNEEIAIQFMDNHRIQELKTKLLIPLMVGETDQFIKLLNNILDEYTALPLANVKIEAYSLVYALHSIAQKEFHFDLSFNMFEEIHHLNQHNDIENIHNWVKHFLNDFLEQFEQWKVERSETIIDQVVDYIQDHYMEACQLSDVAASVYLSPKYLSDLFKKSTGETFTSYLTKVRIKKAELLLSNTKIKVTEIAKMVGYDDPNYFSTVFRKSLNTSPNHYRKQKQDYLKKSID